MKQTFNWIINHLSEVSIAVVALILPIKPLLGWMMALIIIDLITGIWAAYKRGEKITSKELRRTPIKLGGYLIAIIASAIIQLPIFIGDLIPVTRCVATFLAIIELKSIGENITSLTGVPIGNIIKGIFKNKDVIKEIAGSGDISTSENEKDVPNEPKMR